MAGLGLEEEEEVGVLLQLAVVGIMALLLVDFFQVSFDFVLLQIPIRRKTQIHTRRSFLTSSRAMRFWMSSAIRESR